MPRVVPQRTWHERVLAAYKDPDRELTPEAVGVLLRHLVGLCRQGRTDEELRTVLLRRKQVT